MLVPSSATQIFQVPFSITVTVEAPAGGEGEPPAPPTTVPAVTRSFEDPGVTITASIGQVIIAGKYTTILPTTWEWLDNASEKKSTLVPPSVGDFTKITKMAAPSSLTEVCTYIIDGETFTHTVSLGSYTTGRDAMLNLLKEVK